MKNSLKIFTLIISIFMITSSCVYGEVKKNEVSNNNFFPDLIPNPGFEDDHDNDQIPDFWMMENFEQKNASPVSPMKVHSGRKSISINGKGTWWCRVNNIEPQKYFLFSFWIRRDGWKDDEYPSIEIFNKKMYLDELFSSGGWMRMSWYLNSENMTQTDIKIINPGLSHRIYFDDIELRKCCVDLISPEDNSVINTSLPELVWRMPDDDKILDLKIELSTTEDFRNKIVIPTTNALGSSFKITDNLGAVKWYWRLNVFKNDHLITSSKTKNFTVKSDFFPIGIYGAGEDAFSELNGAGFNCVMAAPEKNFILSAKKNGLKCIVSLPAGNSGRSMENRVKEMINTDNVLCWYLDDEPEGRGVSPIHIGKRSNYIYSLDDKQLTGLALLRSKRAGDYGDAVNVLMVDPYPVPRRPMTWLSDSIDESYRSVRGKGKQVWAIIQAFGWKYIRNSSLLKDAENPTFEEERCLTYLAIVHGVKGILFYTYKGGTYKIKNLPEHWNDIKKIASEISILSPVLLATNSSDNLSLDLTTKFSVSHESAGDAGLENLSIKSLDSYNGRATGQESLSLGQANATDANGRPAIHYVFKEVSCGLLEEAELLKVDKKDTKGYNRLKTGSENVCRFIIAVNVINTPVDAVFCNEKFKKNNATVLFEERVVKIDNGRISDHFEPYEVHVYAMCE